ncbi:MAG: threonylcarbamoyl-AMP synthase, partial [Elusimicrobia bacterium]|nr:threonylcarbamoyl-AMP synthase [Elusimicrobiota bacterium]
MIQVQQAVQVLRRGGVVCFPTETVYGLGARLFDEMAIRAVYQIKGRPRDNPLIVHISDLKMLELLAVGMPLETQNLVKKFWPGPLTIVCKKSEFVSRSVTAGLETVAIRMPRHPVATELLSALKEPIAAPSANRSGRPSPTRHEDVLREMRGKADLILDGGQSDFGLESTVVDLAHRPFRILRPGCVTAEELKTVLPEIQINS